MASLAWSYNEKWTRGHCIDPNAESAWQLTQYEHAQENRVGNVHPTPEQFRPFGLATRLTQVVSFPASDSGKTAWYRFRWVNRRSEQGPWSATFTAPIL